MQPQPLLSTAVTTFSGKSVGNEVFRYPVLLESFWQSHSGFHASAFRESQHLCCRQKMSRINFIVAVFLPLDALSPIASLRSLMVFPYRQGPEMLK